MSMEVVVRAARRDDMAARVALVVAGLRQGYAQAVLYFIFQELTLQCCVLGGAVVFIFGGGSPLASAAVVPAAVLLVAALVYCFQIDLAHKKQQEMSDEMWGWVAEARGPAVAGEGRARGDVRVRVSASGGDYEAVDETPLQREVVGTVSVSRWRGGGAGEAGWVHALAVSPCWRRCGVALALSGAARAAASARGLYALQAVTSDLQPGARAFMHAAGWRLRGSYRRPLVWSALTLPVAQLAIDLPYA